MSLFDDKLTLEYLDHIYPRLITQIDRDPDSPTYGSCDRHFWMYRLNDFDSGVLQQSSLALAVLAKLADGGWLTGQRNLNPEAASYWRQLCLGINRRTLGLMARTGYLDEYYPGEQSYPATVFAAHATLKSAQMLDQTDMLEHRSFQKLARSLLEQEPTPAANQDSAAAAFLGLYSKLLNWKEEQVRDRIDNLLGGPDGGYQFHEYGGMDFGYTTVTMNYLAHLHEDGCFDTSEYLEKLARIIAAFITPNGNFGGEFGSRSTSYHLPFGLLAAARIDPSLAGSLSRLKSLENIEKLDDRYMFHYCLPSLALSALALKSNPIEAGETGARSTMLEEISLHETGLYAASQGPNGFYIAMNKGGCFHLEMDGGTEIDCGYRIERAGKVYATSVIHSLSTAKYHASDTEFEFFVEAPFQRYNSLVASPLKTILLRFLSFAGKKLNAYFKAKLVKNTTLLPNVFLRRRVVLNNSNWDLLVEDEIIGLETEDRATVAPPWSLRLVPSAKFYQPGEEPAHDRWMTGQYLSGSKFKRTLSG